MSNLENTKKCSKCQEVKNIENFRKNNSKKDKLSTECKNCCKINNKQWRLKHPDKVKNDLQQWHLKHPKYKKEYNIQYYLNNAEKCIISSKKWTINNPKKRKINNKRWDIKHPEYHKQYHKQRKLVDPIFKLTLNVRDRINHAIRNNIKSGHSVELLGCSVQQYKQYIELQFYNGMTWENQGIGHGKWQIHHICPIEFFDRANPIEQQQAFHYANTKPLWYEDHIEEHRKINERMLKFI